MNQTVVLVALGALCSCVLAALALLAWYVLSRKGGGDAYKGLPSTLDTSGLSPVGQQAMAQLEGVKCDCWEFNNLVRVTIPRYIREFDAQLKDTKGGKAMQKQARDMLDRMLAEFEPVRKKCPDAWVEYPDYLTKETVKRQVRDVLITRQQLTQLETLINAMIQSQNKSR